MAVLKYKDPVSGTWLPLSGGSGGGSTPAPNEVLISTTEPPDPAVELWYDPDAVLTARDAEMEALRARVSELEAWRTDMEARIDQLGNN